MEQQFLRYAPYEKAQTPKEAAVVSNGVRISVLTPCLFRVEEQRSSVFCDKPTQAVICRSFDAPAFTVHKTRDEITVQTELAALCYSYRKNAVISVTPAEGAAVREAPAAVPAGPAQSRPPRAGRSRPEAPLPLHQMQLIPINLHLETSVTVDQMIGLIAGPLEQAYGEYHTFYK